MEKVYILKTNKSTFCFKQLPTIKEAIFYILSNFTDKDKTIELMETNYPYLFQSEKALYPLSTIVEIGLNRYWVKTNDNKEYTGIFSLEEGILV